MSSRGFSAAVGIVAGLVSLIVLGYVEVHAAMRWIVVQGDLSAGFWLGLFLLYAPLTLIPVDVGVAMLIGFFVYGALRGRAEV